MTRFENYSRSGCSNQSSSSRVVMMMTTMIGAMSVGLGEGYYMPGIQSHLFESNDEVMMKVNSMTSPHTQIPRDYYRLPFCQPKEGPKMASENLGEFLTGSKIQSSAYTLNMLRDQYCDVLCQVSLTEKEAKDLRLHIKYGYHHNWIIDNLPSASVGLTADGLVAKHYAGGFPVGYMDGSGKDAYVYNHVNLMVDYHADEGTSNYRVVGFYVEPLSIQHKYANNYVWDGVAVEGHIKPLVSCPSDPKEHVSREELLQSLVPGQIVAPGEHILYTYDVIWKSSPVEWASRWDIYLTEDHMIPAQVHWYSITNSILVVLFLSLLVGNMLVRNLKKDILNYNAAAMAAVDEEDGDEIDESGWKLIHADVFRPPTVNPMLYCVCLGSGVQLAVAALFVILFSAFGFMSPARRGSVMTMSLVFFMLCGTLAGYVSSIFYKMFRGREWRKCTLVTAVLYPGIAFLLFLLFNILLGFRHSSGSAPFIDVLILATMWTCVSVPLVFVGAYFGYRQETLSVPCKISTIARVVPQTTIFLNPMLAMVGAGMVPFAGAYVEIFFIMTSLWMDQFYYIFGFTLIVYVILIITCSEMTVLLCYYQLCAENHRWWWYSFVTSGSTAFYVFAYAVVWFHQLDPSRWILTYFLYFGYMFLISLAVFFITGMAGSLTCFFVIRKIFSAIKVD